ncbi:MAG: hypothetical protein R2684_13130 [Pyrinomonadaceae bacterium]
MKNKTVNAGLVTFQKAGNVQIEAEMELPNYMYFGNCNGGGGPPYLFEEQNETRQVEFKKAAFTNPPNKASTLLPDDCDCITWNSDISDYSSLSIKPKITITPTAATDGDTVGFAATVLGTTPTAYQWSYTSPQGAGNGPSMTFSAPTNYRTDANAHWFAANNAACATSPPPGSPTHPYYNSVYQVMMTVTYQGGLQHEKEQSFTVNAWWDPAGTTTPANISGGPGRIFDPAQNLWVVSSPGNLVRTGTPVTMYVPSTSQFYAKMLAHENEHVAQWLPGGHFGNLYLVPDLMTQLSPLTDPTEQGLVNQINATYLAWDAVQAQNYAALFNQGEILAYNVSDLIPPLYAYQRCGRTQF